VHSRNSSLHFPYDQRSTYRSISTIVSSAKIRRLSLDCWFLLLTVVGVSSLLHLLLEAQRSGTFRWRFEQESGVGPDGADAVLILVKPNCDVYVLRDSFGTAQADGGSRRGDSNSQPSGS